MSKSNEFYGTHCQECGKELPEDNNAFSEVPNETLLCEECLAKL